MNFSNSFKVFQYLDDEGRIASSKYHVSNVGAGLLHTWQVRFLFSPRVPFIIVVSAVTDGRPNHCNGDRKNVVCIMFMKRRPFFKLNVNC